MAIIVIANQYGEEVKEDICEFDKNTSIDELLGFATNGWAFRIPHEKDRKLWNKMIDEKWSGLDDGDYYHYNKPLVFDEKWTTEEDGYFYDLQTAINDARKSLKIFTKIKDIHGGQF